MRSNVLRAGAVVVCALAIAAAGARAEEVAAPAVRTATERASVLLVTLDTTRADHLGCYGDSEALTPYLDAIARSGTIFARALSPVPLTLPSHASLMTGLVPRRHGVRDNTGFRLRDDVPVLAEALRRAGYHTAAFVSAAVLDRRLGLARGFELYDDTVRVGDREAFGYEERAASQTTAAVLGQAGRLVPPFFVWVHYYDPHLPYVPPEPFATRFGGRPYDGEIAFVDWELGGVLSALRRKAGPLLIVVAGDHGESLGEHGESAHGVFVYQATQRVPLFLAGPGVPAGRVVYDNVGLVDLAPTILDLLGLPPLGGRTDGRSLVPALEGRALEPADYELESLFPSLAYDWAPLRALVHGRLKYIEAPRPELYDLATDPGEGHDLAESRPAEARSLAQALGERREGRTASPSPPDAELAELRRRIESLGYTGGTGGAAQAGSASDAIDPKDAIAWLDDLEAGRRAARTGHPSDGVAPLERLLERNPRNVPALLALGLCRLGTGNADRAIESFRRAVEIRPEDDTASLDLANALARKGREDAAARSAAQAEYERTLELNPRRAEAYLDYAAMLFTGGSPEQARHVLERARAAGVQDPDLETEIGLFAKARADVEAARTAFENAVALNPHAAKALEGLGEIAYASGDFAGAADYYARALDARPSADLAKTLGSIRLHHLDQRAGALEAYRRALELCAPGDPDVAELRELVKELEGKSR